MAPHKHSRASPRKPKLEQLKADHELFLQAFEKPTQIYRFLAARHKISPVFMRRTLTYMLKPRHGKKGFSVDSLLEMKENKMKEGRQQGIHSGKCLILTFNHLKWPGGDAQIEDKATIELLLLKVCHKRRKDICLPIMKVSLGQCEIPVNPTAATSNSSTTTTTTSASSCGPTVLTVPSSYFSHSNGHTVRSYRLLLQVRCPTSPALPNGSLCNGDVDSDSDGPLAKRRKVLKGSKHREGTTTPSKEQQEEPKEEEQEQEVEGESQEHHIATFASELVVVDKQNKCQLLDGTYELSLQEVQPKNHKYQTASWETLSDGKTIGPLEVPDLSPRLNFNLFWSCTSPSEGAGEETNVPTASPDRTRSAAVNHAASPDHSHSTMPDLAKSSAFSNGAPVLPTSTPSPARRIHPSTSNTGSPSKSPSSKNTPTADTEEMVERVFYQFLYNNNTRQQTEARNNLRCPWCALCCQRLYSLLKHLTTCHSRFIFTYVPHHKNARIDVAINEHYDGSYSGNPQNLITSHMGYAFQRNGPCRRTPVTQILVMKPTRPKESLQEFQEGENTDYLTHRPYISGHNRTYYHTHSLQPVRPQEMDEDSEDEIDPDWIKERTRMMIDEFTDVNEGEKELMKLWNNHCMKHNFIADSQIPRACSLFIEDYGETILRENLTSNFLLHLINLYDFSLIHPQLIPRLMTHLHRVGLPPRKDSTGSGVNALRTEDRDPPILYPQQTLSEGDHALVDTPTQATMSDSTQGRTTPGGGGEQTSGQDATTPLDEELTGEESPDIGPTEGTTPDSPSTSQEETAMEDA